MKLVYPAIFYPDEETEGYAVVVPDLPGCVSGGDNLAESILMGEDAAAGWIIGEMEDGRKIPKASRIEEIQPDKNQRGGFVSLLVVDLEKYSGERVEKNILIPAYLNTFAEQENLDVSKILQDALFEVYQKYYDVEKNF